MPSVNSKVKVCRNRLDLPASLITVKLIYVGQRPTTHLRYLTPAKAVPSTII